MKRLISILSIAALALTASIAFAHDEGDNDGKGWACLMTFPERCIGPGAVGIGVSSEAKANFPAKIQLGLDKFVAVGSVLASGSSSVTLNVEAGAHLNNVSNGQITVATNADTQVSGSVDVGDRVIVRGEIQANGSLEADSVRVIGEANGKAEIKARKQVAFGKITAVTDNSVTIKNNVTGETKTLTTNDDTKVMVNGEAETTADIQVGDRGLVKFKAMLDTFIATMIRLFR
ncbi:MAG: hypothetical protein HY545_00465 [Candidatus Doudnabacteria bacterium]|nr:hypothetical protein [Candidatus Doudnabacteria bacterium]